MLTEAVLYGKVSRHMQKVRCFHNGYDLVDELCPLILQILSLIFFFYSALSLWERDIYEVTETSV